MKKTLCIALMLVLSVFAFAGCSSTPVPEKLDRWENGETNTYEITMLTPEMGFPDGEWYKYPEAAGVQIMPESIEEGSVLEYAISKNQNGQWVFEVKMTVKQTYAASNLPADWQNSVPQSLKDLVSVNGNTATLTSTMQSTAVFNTVYNSGKPVSSTKTVKSFVVYNNEEVKPALAYNDFVSTATYEGKMATAKFTDNIGEANKPAQKTVDIGDGLVFDNEAMLLAIRSVDFDVLRTAGSTTLSFFNSVEQAMQSITVAYGSDSYTFETGDDAPKYYRIAATPTGMGYPYYYYFEQEEKIAPLGGAGNKIPKYKMVQMNQGYMHFEAVAQA